MKSDEEILEEYEKMGESERENDSGDTSYEEGYLDALNWVLERI